MPHFGDARDQGFGAEPTALTGLPVHARRIREEIFGPVCHVAPFNTEEEPVRPTTARLRTAFGGVKASGIGREGGEFSLDFFSEPVNVCVQIESEQ